MRLFVAANLPDPVKNYLAEQQTRLRKGAHGRFSWVKPENLHITLHFIGDAVEADLKRYDAALQRIAAESTAFTVQLGGCGAFPDRGSPQVGWAGVVRGGEHLENMAQKVKNALETGNPEEKPKIFKPHITLLRVKNIKNPRAFRERLKSLTSPSMLINMKSFELMRSTLKPSGAEYSVVRAYRMPGKEF